jgi:hypothetical protein
MRRKEKVVRVGTVGEFMRREHTKKEQAKREYTRANKIAVASGSFIPLTFLGVKSTFAAEAVNQCGQAIAVATPQVAAVPVGAAATISIKGLLTIFDPIINLIMQISFPTACMLILFKLFMGFFTDQGQVWEGVSKVAIVYVMIQAFPIFKSILLQIGQMI